MSDRESLADTAYVELKRRIVEAEYPPDYQALETVLATEMGMSRTPVREALLRLSNEGLVSLIPRQGMRVLPLSPNDLREIYEALTGLEVMAVDLLGQRNPTRDDLAPLYEVLDEMDRLLTIPDLDAWADADERFHRMLLRLCGNKRIMAIAFSLWDLVLRSRRLTLRLLPVPYRSNEAHRRTVDLLAEGRADEARALHYQQRTSGSAAVTEAVARFHIERM